MAQAALAAVADAGLRLADIDGVFAATSTHAFPTLSVSEYLGLRPRYFDGTNAGAAINGGTPATAAIASGFNGVAPLTLFSRETGTPGDAFAGCVAVHVFCTDVLGAPARAAVITKLKSMGGIA